MAVDPIKIFQKGITGLKKAYEILLNEEYKTTTNKLSHINKNKNLNQLINIIIK